MDFMQKVFAACSRIPKGRVSTYGQIARAIGMPGASRAVGNALNRNRSPSVPCHRVVRSDGSVGGFAHGARAKVRMLENEGLRVRGGRILSFSEKRI
ncbi:MAG TPA: MGMT family protein [Candidatus Bilamarchaeum sp.]|nr:MGMT family protein [Candidatus Bilamarchaeum sp.]